ncbi:hypothetical protein MRB53_038157 [Persea americana]|nr:hypothetical protein MRB53_038157 [Persea americana]
MREKAFGGVQIQGGFVRGEDNGSGARVSRSCVEAERKLRQEDRRGREGCEETLSASSDDFSSREFESP